MFPSDPASRKSRLAKQGQLVIDPAFETFVERFTAAFGFAPLWIEADTFKTPTGARARLDLCCEFSDQTRRIFGLWAPNWTRQQRQAAKIATETISAASWQLLFGQDKPTDFADPSKAVWVVSSSFEEVALSEVHDAVSAPRTREFEEGLGLGTAFWCTNRLWGAPVVFVHTEAEAVELRHSGVLREWAKSYFEIAKKHDEFGYLRVEGIDIRVDSKENFDRKYESNWFYYWR